jgi:simple sugar transport system ATP-binding protein
MNPFKLEMKSITKTYDTNKVIALSSADFSVKHGTIHALVGENGAGKTTLMRILCGLERKDSGSIFLDGTEIEIKNAKEAYRYGIGMVHQHFRLIEDFTVTENVLLGVEKTGRFGFIDKKQNRKAVSGLACKSGFALDPDSIVAHLTIGQRQKVEILKVLYRSTDLIVLDEPTSVLTEQESEELFEIIRTLRQQGKTVIFISHKLDEIHRVCDDITVMRNGRTVDCGAIDGFDVKRISCLVVGENVSFEKAHQTGTESKTVLKVENMTVANKRGGTEAVRDVTFEIGSGEIHAIVGVAGNGQFQLVEALAGLRRISKGTIKLKDVFLRDMNPRQIRENGIAYIPEDRLREGVSVNSSVWENIFATKYYLPGFSNKGWIYHRKAFREASSLARQYEIKTPSIFTEVGKLSGGNIQKVVLTREFSSNPDVLLVCEPTWGLDIRSTKYVYDILCRLRDEGKALLLISCNLDEVLYLANRISVMYKGEFAVTLDNSPVLTKAFIGEYMLGFGSSNNGRRGTL